MPGFKSASPWLWCLFWGAMVIGALALRPLLPVDETRYLSVAWEMQLSGDWLVPHLNGATYSHKPPLLFWIMNAGWQLFGVVDWWPRLVAPLFGLGCLFLTSRLGKRLWPDSQAYLIAPSLLLGSFYWGVYTTLTMFDLMTCLWTLVGLHGLLDVRQGSTARGWLLFAVAIGFGVLSKGPVILVFLLPASLMAPMWITGSISWRQWYLGLLGSFIGGVVIALAWALPAGIAGGEEYRNAIFWGQSAGRIVQSFAHSQPVWWYLAILPGLLLPWLIWPTLLRKLWIGATQFRQFRSSAARNEGLRLAAVWALSALVILSAISGKRPHYLLPMFPALALAGSLLITSLASSDYVRGRFDLLPPALFALILGVVIMFAPEIGAAAGHEFWTGNGVRVWSLPLLGAALFVVARPPAAGTARILSIAGLSALFVIGVHALANPLLRQAYDLESLANRVAEFQEKGYAVANFGKYHGQFNFLGRLTKPVDQTGDGEVARFLDKNPKAKVISYYDRLDTEDTPDFTQKFRGKIIAVWDRETLLPHPGVASRNNEGRRVPKTK